MVDLVSVGSVFIDDIVWPDGRTQMGVLGGGAVHAAAGMALWGERPGLAACVGMGMPAGAGAYLERYFDLAGLAPLDYPQIRAWQVFEDDGTRRELMRVQVTKPFQDGPDPAVLPQDWQDAAGIYALLDGAHFLRWRDRYPDTTILWEPNQPYMTLAHAAEFRRLLVRCDIVSPNLLEARAVFGFQPPEALLRELLLNGAEIAVLRMGAEGSLVATQAAPEAAHIPAVPVARIADLTGAGNTFCGAFLAGWVRTGDAVKAAQWGAVAASFCLESQGVADLGRGNIADERERRLAWAEARTDGV